MRSFPHLYPQHFIHLKSFSFATSRACNSRVTFLPFHPSEVVEFSFNRCLLTSANPVIALSFVIVIIFETCSYIYNSSRVVISIVVLTLFLIVVLVLTLIKGVQQCALIDVYGACARADVDRSDRVSGNRTFIAVLYRDGMYDPMIFNSFCSLLFP